MARVVRGQVISIKTEPFIEAARATGVSQAGIIARHVFPNLVGIVIVYLTLTIPRVMLFEAFLSFLGLGVEPPDVSWGLLANEGIKVITPVKVYWWLIVFPGLALGLTLYALNFLGDGLRDALDPKLAGRRL
jgi:oligopeptide transport system permease protein